MNKSFTKRCGRYTKDAKMENQLQKEYYKFLNAGKFLNISKKKINKIMRDKAEELSSFPKFNATKYWILSFYNRKNINVDLDSKNMKALLRNTNS